MAEYRFGKAAIPDHYRAEALGSTATATAVDSHAIVTQMVECHLPKVDAAGSIPVYRSGRVEDNAGYPCQTTRGLVYGRTPRCNAEDLVRSQGLNPAVTHIFASPSSPVRGP